MQKLLGRPLDEALRHLPEGCPPPHVVETAAPARSGQAMEEGTLRVIAIRGEEWIAARFIDTAPEEKEEA